MRSNVVRIMGILNITPDSFSDGGDYATHTDGLQHADALIAAGADILDIGGESTRPFAEPVSEEKELDRVIPVIEGIRKMHSSIPISIDTTKAKVAREAIKAGANILNDISALRQDPQMITVVQETDIPVIIMHMQGTPQNMQVNPEYSDVLNDIISFFTERLSWATKQNVDHNRFILDPGIGFGKKLEHNLTILQRLNELKKFDLPVLLGHSRKRFIGDIAGIAKEKERDLATAIVTSFCSNKEVSIFRVHNVEATKQALQIADALSVN